MRTFFQAFIGYAATNAPIVLADIEDCELLKTALLGLCVSAIAAGIAALMNLPKKPKQTLNLAEIEAYCAADEEVNEV